MCFKFFSNKRNHKGDPSIKQYTGCKEIEKERDYKKKEDLEEDIHCDLVTCTGGRMAISSLFIITIMCYRY